MFNFSALLTKPMLMAILGLSGLCFALFTYSYALNKQKDKLKEELILTNATLERLNDSLIKERQLHNNTLTALEVRERQRDVKTKEATRLRNQLTEILRNETDECLRADLPSSVVELLQSVQDNRGSSSTDKTTGTAPTEL